MTHPESITLPVTFYLQDSPAMFEALVATARQIDARNAGEVQVEYTAEQALTTVFHEEGIDGLQPLLVGWTVEQDLHWGERRESTPEDEKGYTPS